MGSPVDTVRVAPDVRRRVRELAERGDCSEGDVVAEAIQIYVDLDSMTRDALLGELEGEDVASLRRKAAVRMSGKSQRRMGQLLRKQAQGELAASEARELRALLTEYEKGTAEKSAARAAVELGGRG